MIRYVYKDKVITVKHTSKWISICCHPIVPVKIKQSLVQKFFDTYIIKNAEQILKESDLVFNNHLTDESGDYRRFYERCGYKCSYKEFLQYAIFPFSLLQLCSYNTGEQIASIDFEPDGDIHLIWIQIDDYTQRNFLFNIIQDTMETF